MYMHLKLQEAEKDNFGFSLPGPDGSSIYYRFTVLPWGLAPATYLMNVLISPISYYLHEMGVDFSIFIDDSGSAARSWIKCYTSHLFIQFIFQCAGWEVNKKKSSTFPSQQILYLGFVICTTTMRISAPYFKLLSLSRAINQILEDYHQHGKVPLRQLASILGTMCHLITSHHNVVRLATRQLQHAGGVVVQEQGWSGSIVLTDFLVQELEYSQSILFTHNGAPIKWQRMSIQVINPDQQTIHIESIDPLLVDRPRKIIVSDASISASFYYEADSFKLSREILHEASEAEQSSSLRELLAVSKMLQTEKAYLKEQRGKLLVWCTDSQVNYINFLCYW